MSATLRVYWWKEDSGWHGPDDSTYETAVDAAKVADQIFVQWPAAWGVAVICQVIVGPDIGRDPVIVYQRNFDAGYDSVARFGSQPGVVKYGSPLLEQFMKSQSVPAPLVQAFSWDMGYASLSASKGQPLPATVDVIGYAIASGSAQYLSKFQQQGTAAYFSVYV